MKYISTRSKKKFSFKEIIKLGMPKNGGLFIAQKIPYINFRSINKNIKYYKLVRFILSFYMNKKEYKYFNIKKISKKIYNNNYFNHILKIKKIKDKNVYVVNLNNGLTLSFKDIAICFLSEIFKKINSNIITATSGDTGSSCVFHLRNTRTKTYIFSPYKKISLFQELQMFCIKKQNIYNISLVGNFDNCQKIIKNTISKFNQFNTFNSVNFLRIILQSIYYIKIYLLFKTHKHQLEFVIPTGNFGNAFAAFMCQKMGLNINIKIVNNDNNSSYNFIKKKKINFIKKVIKTNCPSMDINKPSNLERLAYYILNKKDFNHFIKNFKSKHKFNFNSKNKCLKANYCKKQKRNNIIKKIYKQTNVLLDPHTANSFSVTIKKNKTYFIINTAKAIKFIDYLNKLIKKTIYFKYYNKIKCIKKKFFSFKKKDKTKIINFIKKTKLT
ncbi:hypothetical protein [Candidatus Vidania fulgoroideorum]